MKKLSVLLAILVILVSMPIHAAASEYRIDDESALNFAESDRKGIPHDVPLHEKTWDQLIREGYQFYGGTVPFNPYMSPFATHSGVLGYISASGKTYVYSSPGTGTQLGYLTFREIVYIRTISGSYAYVQFKNASGNFQYGYINNTAVYSPAYGWNKPILTGRISQYFGATTTNPKGHTGIDVAANRNSLIYATYAGTANYFETTKKVGDTFYFADYGKWVRLDSGIYKTYYAHLNSFGQSVSSNSYASEGYPVPDFLVDLTPSTRTVATKSVSKGALLGYVGSTGQSSDNHLHFEVRVNGQQKDPFTYIVFPDVSWAS